MFKNKHKFKVILSYMEMDQDRGGLEEPLHQEMLSAWGCAYARGILWEPHSPPCPVLLNNGYIHSTKGNSVSYEENTPDLVVIMRSKGFWSLHLSQLPTWLQGQDLILSTVSVLGTKCAHHFVSKVCWHTAAPKYLYITHGRSCAAREGWGVIFETTQNTESRLPALNRKHSSSCGLECSSGTRWLKFRASLIP